MGATPLAPVRTLVDPNGNPIASVQQSDGTYALKTTLAGSNAQNGAAVPATAVYIGGLAGDGAHLNVPAVLSGPIPDGQTDAFAQFMVIANQRGWNGASYDRVRVGDGVVREIDNANVGAGGVLNVWTPASGKRFRLLAAAVGVTALAAGSYLILQDSTGNVIWKTWTVGQFMVPLPQNGYLSTAANNILRAFVGTAGAATNVSISAFGTEE